MLQPQCPLPPEADKSPVRVRPSVNRVLALVAGAVVLAVLAAACGSGASETGEQASVLPTAPEGIVATATLGATVVATEEPTLPPATATPTRTPVPGPPINMQVIAEYVPYPPRIDHLVQSNDLIVVGHIIEVLPARWTTPDGVRPENPHTYSYTIITPAVLEIEEVLFDRAGLDLDGARVIVTTGGGVVGADSVTDERALETGTRLFAVLAPYTDHSGKPLTLRDERIWYPHTRYTLTADGRADPSIQIWETRATDELLDGIRAYVAGEPWRRPGQYGQCMPEDAPLSLMRFVGGVNMAEGEALSLLFPFAQHPGGVVEPHAEGGMQVFYGYEMADETAGVVVFDDRKDRMITHFLERHAANERWYAQDFVFTENLDEALGMPHVNRGTFQFVREADDLPAVTMLADIWFNCIDGSILSVRGWQAQAGVATASLIGSDYDMFPSWPEWMPDNLYQRTTVDGTRWRPVELQGQAVEVVSYPNLNISGGYLFGNAGCDMYNFKHLTFAEGHVAIDRRQATRWESYCEDTAVEELEERFFAALDEVSTYRIVDGLLVFRNAAHEVVMIMVKDL